MRAGLDGGCQSAPEPLPHGKFVSERVPLHRDHDGRLHRAPGGVARAGDREHGPSRPDVEPFALMAAPRGLAQVVNAMDSTALLVGQRQRLARQGLVVGG